MIVHDKTNNLAYLRKASLEKKDTVVDLRTPQEKEMYETLQKYKQDEAKLEKIEAEKFATPRALFWDTIYLSINAAIIYYFCVITGSIWGYDPEGHMGKVLATFFALVVGGLGGCGLVALGISWLETRDSIRDFYQKNFLRKKEQTRLVQEKSDREEFYRLYELMKDPDFRKEYLGVYKSKEEKFMTDLLGANK